MVLVLVAYNDQVSRVLRRTLHSWAGACDDSRGNCDRNRHRTGQFNGEYYRSKLLLIMGQDAFRELEAINGVGVLVAEQPRRTAASFSLANVTEVTMFLERCLSLPAV